MIAVEGRITFGDSCDALEADLKSILNAGEYRIVLDASRLRYIDSAGIGLLIMAGCKAQAAGGSLCVRGAKAWIHDAVTRCRIEHIIRFVDNAEEDITAAAAGTAHSESSIAK